MRHACYLKRSRHGIWYFRFLVPHRLRLVFGRRELTRSLHTSSRGEAICQARLLSAHADQFFREILSVMAGPKKPNLGDLGINFDVSTIRGWTVKSPSGFEIRTEPGDQKDHENGLQALQEVLQRESGLQRPLGPQPTTVPAAGTSRLVSEVAEVMYSENADWSPATMIEYRSVLEAFTAQAGDLPCAQVTSRTIADFTSFLRNTKKNSQRTIDKKLNPLSTLFTIAQRDGDYPHDRDLPTKGHYKFRKARRSGQPTAFAHKPFDSEEIAAIFEPSVFKMQKRPHEYWGPLIAAFTAARVSEVAQLKCDDIAVTDSVPTLRIHKDDPKNRVKTNASLRTIPVHPALINLGLLDYVDAVRALGQERLFFYLPWDRKNGFGGAMTKAFSRYLEKRGIKIVGKSFHSFRKVANDRMEKNDVSQEVRIALLGHESDDVNIVNYTTPHTMPDLIRRGWDRLNYPEIDLTRLRKPKDAFNQSLNAELVRKTKQDAHRAASARRKGSTSE